MANLFHGNRDHQGVNNNQPGGYGTSQPGQTGMGGQQQYQENTPGHPLAGMNTQDNQQRPGDMGTGTGLGQQHHQQGYEGASGHPISGGNYGDAPPQHPGTNTGAGLGAGTGAGLGGGQQQYQQGHDQQGYDQQGYDNTQGPMSGTTNDTGAPPLPPKHHAMPGAGATTGAGAGAGAGLMHHHHQGQQEQQQYGTNNDTPAGYQGQTGQTGGFGAGAGAGAGAGMGTGMTEHAHIGGTGVGTGAGAGLGHHGVQSQTQGGTNTNTNTNTGMGTNTGTGTTTHPTQSSPTSQIILGKLESAAGTVLSSQSLKAKGDAKVAEGEAIRGQARETKNAENLEEHARLARERAGVHGARKEGVAGGQVLR